MAQSKMPVMERSSVTINEDYNLYADKIGNTVTLQAGYGNVSASASWSGIGQIPAGYRPKRVIYWSSYDGKAEFSVNNEGWIQIRPTSGQASTVSVIFTVTYVVD